MSYTYDDLSSSSTSEDETFDVNPGDLQPYAFEPLPRISDAQIGDGDTEHAAPTRKGNTNWCSCGKCRAMDTEEESLCCRKTEKFLSTILKENYVLRKTKTFLPFAYTEKF